MNSVIRNDYAMYMDMMHRSHDIEKRSLTVDARKLPNLLSGRNFVHPRKEEEGKPKAASAAYEKAKPSEEGFDRLEKAINKSSEEAGAGYEKANPSHRRSDYRKIHFSGSK